MVATKFISGGNGLLGWWNIAGCCGVFHITTLEEYYLGELYL
jgi:hypothetical protein